MHIIEGIPCLKEYMKKYDSYLRKLQERITAIYQQYKGIVLIGDDMAVPGLGEWREQYNSVVPKFISETENLLKLLKEIQKMNGSINMACVYAPPEIMKYRGIPKELIDVYPYLHASSGKMVYVDELDPDSIEWV